MLRIVIARVGNSNFLSLISVIVIVHLLLQSISRVETPGMEELFDHNDIVRPNSGSFEILWRSASKIMNRPG